MQQHTTLTTDTALFSVGGVLPKSSRQLFFSEKSGGKALHQNSKNPGSVTARPHSLFSGSSFEILISHPSPQRTPIHHPNLYSIFDPLCDRLAKNYHNVHMNHGVQNRKTVYHRRHGAPSPVQRRRNIAQHTIRQGPSLNLDKPRRPLDGGGRHGQKLGVRHAF
jgi:hypothetical protein